MRRLFSFVTLVIVFLLLLPLGVYSRPSAERPITQRYTLAPPVFERLLRATRITPHTEPAIDVRPYFESQGVAFDRGCIASLNPSTRVLTIKNTTANRELIELIFEHVLHATIGSPTPE